MNFLSKVISSKTEIKERLVKILRLGNRDVQEADQVSPFGIDSNPVKDMISLYSDTLNRGEPVIIGYLSINALAKPGETRLFSTNSKGEALNYLWLKADGTIEIGGHTDNMVRFSKLEAAFNEFKSDFNNLVSIFNTHTHSGGTISGSTGVPASSGTPSSADIGPAKIDELKTS